MTARGWQEIHNPASTHLSLKLFHISNVSCGSTGTKRVSLLGEEGGLDIGDSLKEVHDLEELKNALTTMREAMAMALPWNKSISAIQGFLNTSSFCAKDLANRSNRAAIISNFINYVLSRNALNWQNQQGFLSTNELLHVWATWYGQQPASSLLVSDSTSKGKRPAGGSVEQPKEKKVKDDLCRKYNSTNGCPTTGPECRTFYGLRLRHLCNFKLPGGKFCEKLHPKPEH